VLDEGQLTDSQGHKVDFRNTVIIMTSNIGSELFSQVDDAESVRSEVCGAVLWERADCASPG
jgi:ATP-dependent Clp protease ATP-binding subunit ClpA